MKTLRKLIYAEVLLTVGFVCLVFLGLFFFFDLIDELQWVGKGRDGGYQVAHALTYVSLMVPSHVYEVLPIAVLIGTIAVMARMAQSSEFTILRTSGLGPVQALRTLLGLGLGFVLLAFVVGDYLSPLADRQAQLLKSRHLQQITVGQTGAWLREKLPDSLRSVNIQSLTSDGDMRGIRIFEFDRRGVLLSFTQAAHGEFDDNDEAWLLSDVDRDEFTVLNGQRTELRRQHHERLAWTSGITQDMVSVALLKPSRMGTIDLFQYIRHLEENAQTALRYEIEFWKKVFYPISCLVMVVLALPFAYLHFRSGNIASYVFVGVLIGISFFLLNNVFGYIGNLSQWAPWLAAAAPGLIYTLVSLGAFGWLVLRQ